MPMNAAHAPEKTLQRDVRWLADLLREAGIRASVEDDAGMRFDHVTEDSREVGPGGLFVAVRGAAADGHRFLDAAAGQGAAVLVYEQWPGEGVVPGAARVRVSDSRRALAAVAAAWNDYPARGLTMVGVTGTNGKTTTAWLVAQAADRCAFVGTIGAGFPPSLRPSTLTTPDPVSLQASLARFRTEGALACAMEVSSHALDQRRTDGIDFAVAVFTNLTRDHLDYHADRSAYLGAKARLFTALGPASTAVVNGDDPASNDVLDGCVASVVRFGTAQGSDVRYRLLADTMAGMTLELDGDRRPYRLAGAFNAANVAAAYGVLRAMGMSRAESLEALADAKAAPGRFELLRRTGDRAAIVDYAHTPDALERLLEAARSLVPAGGRLWCVFGCGGDRDRGKRQLMGAVAERLADRVLVTSDNPRTEDPEAILRDVRSGMDRPDDALWIADRRAAIGEAVRGAAAGDLVVVAGKGHEDYQVIGREKRPFDDREEILHAFAAS